MTALTMTLEPAESAELLQSSANIRLLDERDQRGWRENKRDLVLCMERHRLLVAMDGDTPRAIPGPEGRLLVAFTDDDAAHTWAESRHPAEGIEHRFAPSEQTAPRSERDGRRWWLQWCERLDATAIMVNPVGPVGFLAFAQECRESKPRLRRREIPGSAEPWLDLDARAAERARVTALMSELAGAVDAGDDAAFDRLRVHISNLNRMGNGLWAAENQIVSGRRRLRHGEEMAGAYQQMYGGLAYGRVADPYRSIDALLSSADVLLDQHARGASDAASPDFPGDFLRQVADGLATMRLGYREPEIDALSEWASTGAGASR